MLKSCSLSLDLSRGLGPRHIPYTVGCLCHRLMCQDPPGPGISFLFGQLTESRPSSARGRAMFAPAASPSSTAWSPQSDAANRCAEPPHHASCAVSPHHAEGRSNLFRLVGVLFVVGEVSGQRRRKRHEVVAEEVRNSRIETLTPPRSATIAPRPICLKNWLGSDSGPVAKT